MMQCILGMGWCVRQPHTGWGFAGRITMLLPSRVAGRTLALRGPDLARGPEVARPCPTAWNCHLHPSLRFSGSSNHLILAFFAVASLGNLCPPKLLHLGTQHSVPRLFLLRLSMPPTATHQQDNSYGRSAIWRVSKFVIHLIDRTLGHRMPRVPVRSVTCRMPRLLIRSVARSND